MKVKSAFLKGEALLASIRESQEMMPDGNLVISWLGQSGFLVSGKPGDPTILFDPYLSDSLTEKYQTTDKPHIRITEQVIKPEDLDFIDIVTSSHNHTDHLDAFTLKPLFQANPEIEFVIPEANRQFVATRLECDAHWPIGMNDGESIECRGIRLTGVPAAHESIDRDDHGRCHYMGFIARIGDWTLYHSGDTMYFDGMEDLLSAFSVDIALLPINGRKPERRVAGNLNGEEAAKLAKAIQASVVIPCHYDMFEFNTESPDLFESSASSLLQNYQTLQNGESFTTENLLPRQTS